MKVCLCVLALLFGFLTVGRAETPPLIVLLLPGTSLRQWQRSDAPYLHQLMATGALAVMNTRTARLPNDRQRESPESALRTLGAGSRAAGDPGQSVGYDLHIGNLADTLAARGVIIQAGGGPGAALVAADGMGHLSHAAALTARPDSCLVWDAGPDVAQADAVIGSAREQVTRQSGRLIVLSPYADDSDYAAGRRLTPILEWGRGVPAGLLYSPSTHRAGLVTNTDFAPSIAEYFGIARGEFAVLPFGYAWFPQTSAQAVAVVSHIDTQAVRQSEGMRLLPYLAAVLAVWIGFCTWRIFRRRPTLLGPLLPMAALTAALVSVSATTFGLAICVILAAVGASAKRFGVSLTVTLLAALSAAFLSIDLLTGSRWMHQSLLGYSAIEGARYYGLGNEAMGLLIGSVLIMVARFWPRQQAGRWLWASVLAGLCLLLGSLGAKAGGLLVSVAAFGTFLYRANGGQWSGRTVLALGGIVAAVPGAVALADAFLPPQASSHIGEAVRRIASGGLGEAWDIIQRKLAVEGRLAYHSAWALLLWGGLLCTLTLWRRNKPHGRNAEATREAGLVGIVACLVLNDAGVIAAALFVAVLWSVSAAEISDAPASA